MGGNGFEVQAVEQIIRSVAAAQGHDGGGALVGQVAHPPEQFVYGPGALEPWRQALTWPLPVTMYFVVVSSRSPIGPRACNF